MDVEAFKRQRIMGDLFEATVRVAHIDGVNPLLLHNLALAVQRIIVTYGGSAQFGNAGYLVQLMRDLAENPTYLADVRALAELQGKAL